MSIVRIIPISDESNRTEFIYANYNSDMGMVVYEKKKQRVSGSNVCSLTEFLKMTETNKKASKYISEFKKISMEEV